MRKLILASAGQARKHKGSYSEEFLEFLGRDPKGMKLCYVPTAASLEADKSFVEIIRRDLLNFGFQITDLYLESENAQSLYEKLKTFDVIFMSGGNTFYLLDQVRKSGFDTIIGKLLDQGIIYMGVSAGSYIACPTIEMAAWKHQDRNVVGLKDLAGLNLVPFLISAHYEKEKWLLIKEGIEHTQLPVAVLTDQQAVMVVGDKAQIVGQGEKLVYNGFQEI